MKNATNLIGVALSTVIWIGLAAGDTPYEVKDQTKVYYGDPRGFENPAVLEAARVFAQIKEYREIQQKGLTSRDPEYWILLEKANRKFRRAVHRTAQRDGRDLVAEIGAVARTDGAALPDVTVDVIQALDKE